MSKERAQTSKCKNVHVWCLPCVTVVKLCADVTCANGGTCKDTMSGFKCHCIFGRYNGSMCENGEWYTLTFNVETTRDMTTCVEYILPSRTIKALESRKPQPFYLLSD